MIIAPDAGRVKLVRNFARKVGAPYALLEKERPAQGVAEIGHVIGDVSGKTAVIVDDIIGTGGTLAAAAQTVHRRGREQRLRGGHPRPLRRQRLREPRGLAAGGHRRDRHGAAPRAARPAMVRQLTSADILTDSIRRIFLDDSVSEIFAGENQLF